VKIALAQIDPTVGDFTGNLEKSLPPAAALRVWVRASRFSPSSPSAAIRRLTFLRNPASWRAAARPSTNWPRQRANSPPRFSPASPSCRRHDGKPAFNAAVLLDRGRLLLEQHKRLLPFYDVFDEQRYFSPSGPQKVIELDGVRLAVTICEDAWNDKNFWPRRLYSVDPVEELMRQAGSAHQSLFVAVLAFQAHHPPRDAGGHRPPRRHSRC
jgi:NAD+ synthase (glutamine-hydrolysing)